MYYMNNRYKLVIAYDGTHFSGWQEQANKRTIAQELKDSFLELFGSPIGILGSSRTDAGVHALGQVALIRTKIAMNQEQMRQAWNNSLKQDIYIRSIKQLDHPFHPWYGVTEKVYYYHLFAKRPLPIVAQYGWYYPHQIDWDKLETALQLFVGTHDFRSFTTGDGARGNTVRTIDAIDCLYLKRFGVYRISVRGKKFMRYMIRRIVGAAVHVAARKAIDPSIILDTLSAKDPHHHLIKAPAHGLMLRSIRYKNE